MYTVEAREINVQLPGDPKPVTETVWDLLKDGQLVETYFTERFARAAALASNRKAIGK